MTLVQCSKRYAGKASGEQNSLFHRAFCLWCWRPSVGVIGRAGGVSQRVSGAVRCWSVSGVTGLPRMPDVEFNLIAARLGDDTLAAKAIAVLVEQFR